MSARISRSPSVLAEMATGRLRGHGCPPRSTMARRGRWFFAGALAGSVFAACSDGPKPCPPGPACPAGEVTDPNTCGCTPDDSGSADISDASSEGAHDR